MGTIKQKYDPETYGRMEFLTYLLIILTLLALATVTFAFYNWLIG